MTLSLLEPYRNASLNVTCDNFFTSLSLAKKKILNQQTTIVGTIRGHRREIPNKIRFEKDAALYSSNFFLCIATREHHDIQLQSKEKQGSILAFL